MKFFTATILTVASSYASAFTPTKTSTPIVKQAAKLFGKQPGAEPTEIERTIPSGNSIALPWMKRPDILDGSLPGDAGFDPLGFAKSEEDLTFYRQAEIKHCRLAMLAAAGWPLSEVFDQKLASIFGLPEVVDSAGRAPSLLNGGLGKVSPVYWVAVLGAAAAIDLYGIEKAKAEPSAEPGDLGFDPLGLYPKDPAGRKEMKTKELKNGRLAMVAITAFAAQEFVTKIGVAYETPRKSADQLDNVALKMFPGLTHMSLHAFSILPTSWRSCPVLNP